MGQYIWIPRALLEFLINILISTLPFVVGIGTLMLSAKLNLDFFSAFKKISSNGELIIYSATLMAPIMYAVLRDPPVAFRAGFAISGGIPVVLGVLVYVISMTDGFTHRLSILSTICFILAVIVYLLLLLVQHEFEHRKSAPQIQEDRRNDRLDGYRKHRESQS
jgi:hypothetical protein